MQILPLFSLVFCSLHCPPPVFLNVSKIPANITGQLPVAVFSFFLLVSVCFLRPGLARIVFLRTVPTLVWGRLTKCETVPKNPILASQDPKNSRLSQKSKTSCRVLSSWPPQDCQGLCFWGGTVSIFLGVWARQDWFFGTVPSALCWGRPHKLRHCPKK